MNENEELQSGFPDWLTEDYKLMEPVFCQAFLREHPMRCIRGRFYTVDGPVADESSLKQKIYEEISPWLETKIARKVDELLNALRMAAYSEPIRTVLSSPLSFYRRSCCRHKAAIALRFCGIGSVIHTQAAVDTDFILLRHNPAPFSVPAPRPHSRHSGIMPCLRKQDTH